MSEQIITLTSFGSM